MRAMTTSIVHARSWDNEGAQYFVTLSPSRDEISLYESVHQVSCNYEKGTRGCYSNNW